MNKPEFYQQIEYNKQFINKGSKTLQKAKSVKNSLRTQAKKSSDPKVKHTNYIRQSELIISWKNPKKNRINSNKLYTKNNVLETIFFFKFSKSVCNGSFGAPMKGINFSKDKVDQFFVPKNVTVPEHLVDTSINWLPFIPDEQKQVPYNMSVIKPQDVKQILSPRSNTSSPGPDGISYVIMKRLPCLHHVLATLYTKILQSGCPHHRNGLIAI